MRTVAIVTVFIVAAAWAVSRPAAECPPRADQAASLSCELAVAAALGALPSHHAPIARIQFLYGSLIFYFPALLPSDEQGTIGYVLFTYEDGSRDYVDVAEFHGELSASAPMPYPQTSASQARPSRPGEDRPAVLSIEDRSSGPVLVVDGVLTAPADLPVGAWVKVSDQEVADMAVLATPPSRREVVRGAGTAGSAGSMRPSSS